MPTSLFDAGGFSKISSKGTVLSFISVKGFDGGSGRPALSKGSKLGAGGGGGGTKDAGAEPFG